jgi:hypothetical protein
MHRFAVSLLGADETRPGVRQAVQATLDLLRGLGVANLLSDDKARRDTVLAGWKQYLVDVLRPDPSPDGDPRDTAPGQNPPDQ